MFERKPHKIRNARVLLGVIAGLGAGILARQFAYQRFGVDPGDPQLESFLSGANALGIGIGAIMFGVVGGICGIVLGYFMGRSNPAPPFIGLAAVFLVAVLTMNFEWVVPANLLFLLGYLLFTIEGAVLYEVGRRKAVERWGAPDQPEMPEGFKHIKAEVDAARAEMDTQPEIKRPLETKRPPETKRPND